jgi:8-oxo-dGTP pyrophosphatase MutT (NUDIX family)
MKIVDKKIVWEGKFLRTLLISYEDKSGNLRNWEAVERVNCRGIVVVVPITKEGEFLLIRQFRPVINNFVIEFPAGLNDKDESLIDTARRELIEETGYDSSELIYLADGPVSSGMSTEILTVFLAKEACLAPADIKEKYPADESENIETIKAPFSKVYEILHCHKEKGDYIDLKVYGLIEMAKEWLKTIK